MQKHIQTLKKRYRQFKDLRTRKYFLIGEGMLRGGLLNAIIQGEGLFELLDIHTDFKTDATILDAGCGDGKNAAAFARHSERYTGHYYGFDTDKNRLNGLKEVFEKRPKFTFTHADIFHSYYNKEGTIPPVEFTYPYGDKTFDLIYYNSIFSHMKLAVIEHSLKEAARCLGDRGQIYASFYILDKNAEPNFKPDDSFTHPFDEGFTATPEKPEGLVAYPKETILKLFEKVGLTPAKYIPGFWKMKRTSRDQHGQDIFILEY